MMTRTEAVTSFYEITAKTLKEYSDDVESTENRKEGLIMWINSDEVQLYLSSSTTIMLSINGIGRSVDSFEKVKSVIESEVMTSTIERLNL